MTVHGHARRLVEAIPDDVRADVLDDPRSAIEVHFEMTVTPAISFGQRGAGGWCDGASITDAGIILFRPTESRRQNFTLAHELGHHLLAEDDDAPSWLADQERPRAREEEICDLIAARLLVPDERIVAALAGGPPSPATVATLYATTVASRTACAVALAVRIPCDGFVVLTEPGSRAVFAAARTRDTRPYPWRGDAIPAANPLSRPDPPSTAKTWWADWRGQRREFYMSAGPVDGYICGVFAETDLWCVETLHVYTPVAPDRGYDGSISCPCGYRGKTRMWPCADCGVPECRSCHECECARRALREPRGTCRICTKSVRSHLLVDGLCDDCR
jgi:hypothetical protein